MDRNLLSLALILVLAMTALSGGAGLARRSHTDSLAYTDLAVARVVANEFSASPGHAAPAKDCSIVFCGNHVALMEIPELVAPRVSAIVSALPFTGWRENAVTRDPEPPRA